MTKPMLVALCGYPKSGKSEIQMILNRHFGLIPIDDGDVLRRHCMELFDLTYKDVSTQEGKASHSVIQDVDWENRKIIGEYGNALEKTFGDLVIPNWALRHAKRRWNADRLSSARNELSLTGYSFGSVRRSQGRAYANEGAIVLEITRPGIGPSGNVWDEYDPLWVSHSYHNSKEGLQEMERDFISFFEQILREDETGDYQKYA